MHHDKYDSVNDAYDGDIEEIQKSRASYILERNKVRRLVSFVGLFLFLFRWHLLVSANQRQAHRAPRILL